MEDSQSALIAGTAIIAPGQAAYVKLPSDVVLKWADKKFPIISECADADFIKGGGHRWKAGHDLLVDVPRTFMEHGPIRAINHAAHIVLTDLPTKAGIPIPGLSGEGLGSWLVEHEIPKGYLSIHWADGAFGILTIAEGSTDLLQAVNGTLTMNGGVFFDTFIEGSAEIAIAFAAKNAWKLGAFNPVVAGGVGGIENIIAGVVSAYQTVSVYVDPLVFFGSAGTSALIGFGLAYGVADESLGEASINGIRSGAVGAFYSLSPAFGYGALAGFVSYKLGGKLADIHNKSTRVILEIDDKAYELLLDELCKGNVHLTEFLDRAEIHITFIDNAATLSMNCNLLDTGVKTLTDQYIQLNYEAKTLGESTARLKSNAQTLPDDSPILTDLYRAVLAH